LGDKKSPAIEKEAVGKDKRDVLMYRLADGHRSANTRPHMLSNKVFDKGDRSVCAFCNTVINPSQHTPLVALYCSGM
jgi:hypothetical protein